MDGFVMSDDLNPIQRAIDRQLSALDRRMLVNRSYYLAQCGISVADDGVDLSDGGFNARIIEQAVDLVLMRSRARVLQDDLEKIGE